MSELRIAIVEDGEYIARALNEILQKAGHASCFFEGLWSNRYVPETEEGIDTLVGHILDFEPDVILLDHHLGVVTFSGEHVAYAVRERLPEIALVSITSDPDWNTYARFAFSGKDMLVDTRDEPDKHKIYLEKFLGAIKKATAI